MVVPNKRIYLSSPHMGNDELKYINKAFKNNWIAPLGPNVDAFEKSIVRYCKVKYAAALSSGTAALHLALIILGIKPGDEVIAPSFTFSATVNPIVYQGATPILVDSEPETWNMNPDLLEIAIKDRIKKKKRPKAIIVAHIYGMPANMLEIVKIASNFNIPIIEDAAEALGSRFQNRSVGTFGTMSIFSFNGNKIITTSTGGSLVSSSKELVSKAKFLASQSRDKARHYQHSQIGYNYRMSNVLAGIGLGQMKVLNDRVNKRREIFLSYKMNLQKLEEVKFQKEPDEIYFSNRWLTTILLDTTKKSKMPEELQKALEKENIESRPLWKPMHLQPIFSSCPAYLNGTSEFLFNKGLCLPSGSNMSEEDQQRVIDVLLKILF